MTEIATSENPFVIVFIDDDKRTSSNMFKFISRASNNIPIKDIYLHPDDISSVEDLVAMLDRDNASIVLIDHRLGEKSNAKFTGLDLADSIRILRSSLPLFILTKWANDDILETRGFSVDDVMDKSRMREHTSTYVGRLLRAAGRYVEARNETSKRINELIVLSLQRELNKEEVTELNNLRARISLVNLSQEIEFSEKIKQRIKTKQEILSALQKLIKNEE